MIILMIITFLIILTQNKKIEKKWITIMFVSQPIPGFGLKVGGIISGSSVEGSSVPALFCLTKYIAKANCSEFNFPLCLRSHKVLLKSNTLV